MQAVQFVASIPRYVLGKALGPVYCPFYWQGRPCLRLADVPRPRLVGPRWVRVRVTCAGICGSDLSLAFLRESPSLEPFSSSPFVVGHEIVGVVGEAGPEVASVQVGDRVVVDPVLHCAIRGFADLCPACARGDTNLCTRFTAGDLAPGMFTGTCRDTGGGWSEELVAHEAQLYRIPDRVPDEAAVLTDPLASALHPVLRHVPSPGATVLVVGAGIIGLFVIASLRAIGCRNRIVVLSRHRYQAVAALRLGADETVLSRRDGGHSVAVARAFGARTLKPILGPAVFVGGADQVFDCVGSASSLGDSLRLVRAGGKVVVIGLAGSLPGTDWTPLWQKEIQVVGSYAYAVETLAGRTLTTYAAALDLIASGRIDVSGLVTHRFALADYGRALEAASAKARTNLVKAVLLPC